MTGKEEYFRINKDTWNKKVGVHAASTMYDMENFVNGDSSLKTYELEALGEVKGKFILHLQCHFGQDTLSLSRMGGKCTGVDFSEEAIALARKLNDQLGLDASFVCCNVLDTSEYVDSKFDIVFSSYGVIGWLPDLKGWGRMIGERLKPGGFFYLVEFHPIVWMFDYLRNPPELVYPYSSDVPVYEEYEGTYADVDSKIISREYGWNHGFSDVLNALIGAGLNIESFQEYDESPYNVFPQLELQENGMYKSKKGLYPLIFSVKARKPQ